MSEIAILTESHKTDTRDKETQIIEGVLERQNKQDKEPRSQFFSFEYFPTFATSYNLEYRYGANSRPFFNAGGGVLLPTDSHANWPTAIVGTTPSDLLTYPRNSLSFTDLDFYELTNIKYYISYNATYFYNAALGLPSFGGNYTIPYYACFYFTPSYGANNIFLKVKLFDATYTNSSNSYSITHSPDYKRILNLRELVTNQNFVNAEVLGITQSQFESLKNGALIQVFFGWYFASANSPEQAHFFSRINRFEISPVCQIFNYGNSKAAVQTQATIIG